MLLAKLANGNLKPRLNIAAGTGGNLGYYHFSRYIGIRGGDSGGNFDIASCIASPKLKFAEYPVA